MIKIYNVITTFLPSYIATSEGNEWTEANPPSVDDKVLIDALKDTLKIAIRTCKSLKLDLYPTIMEAMKELHDELSEDNLIDELPDSNGE